MTRKKLLIALCFALGAVVAGFLSGYLRAIRPAKPIQIGAGVFEIDRIEYRDPPRESDDPLVDDTLDGKAPAFDEALVDSRPLDDYEVNASAAVIRLDCPAIRFGQDGPLDSLRRTFAEAIPPPPYGSNVLPSANLLDGAAKQFDDGLYVAIDLACYRGDLGISPAAPEVVQAMFGKLPPGSKARPFLAAALELAGRTVALKPEEEKVKQELLARFEADPIQSKPLGFYTWTPELKPVWRFYRFLQQEFAEDQLDACRAVAGALEADPGLRGQYHAINDFYGRLTNPPITLLAETLIGGQNDLKALAKQYGARRAVVSVFPPSTSRETELFDRLFPDGIPPGVNLMSVLVRRIRSGEVNLKPGPKDGWYQHQVYALESMLLPTRGQEAEKLQLTANYKKRLVEAFKALVTKHRETHVRQLARPGAKEAAAPPLHPDEVRPRLRVEPCPTFYLRTARAYAFLENFLLATVGKERLAKLHGLKQGGTRGPSLADELAAIRLRFYGFYLVSCEDLGMKPQFLKDEPVDAPAAKAAALEWLKVPSKDPDLACDTRVAVPIYIDRIGGKIRMWATLGVRLAPLTAEYARPPKIRPKKDHGLWQELEPRQLRPAEHVIPVEEFAEFELTGAPPTRDEFRALCDRHKTKEEIVKAITSGP